MKLITNTQTHSNNYLSLKPLLVIVEEAEAVKFVLWWRAACAVIATLAACFISGFGSRRRSLKMSGKHMRHNTNRLFCLCLKQHRLAQELAENIEFNSLVPFVLQEATRWKLAQESATSL